MTRDARIWRTAKGIHFGPRSELMIKRVTPLLILSLAWLGGTAAVAMVAGHVQKQPARDRIDVSTLGPQVGDRVPDFSLSDQSGKTWTLRSIMGPKGAMLVFYRSADW